MKKVVDGIVMEINEKSVVIMTKDGEFIKVKKPRQSFSLGEEITSTVFEETNRFKYMAVAAAILLLLTPFVYLNRVYATVAYVNIDINPSLEVGINKYNKVNNAIPLNDDGKALLQNLSLKGLDIKDAVDKIINSAKDMGYIKDNGKNSIEIALVKLNKKDTGISDQNLKEYAESTLSKGNIDAKVEVHSANKKIHDEAKKENMSTNKYLDKVKNEKGKVEEDDKKESPQKDKEKGNGKPNATDNHPNNDKIKSDTPNSELEKDNKNKNDIKPKIQEEKSNGKKAKEDKHDNGKDNGGKMKK